MAGNVGRGRQPIQGGRGRYHQYVDGCLLAACDQTIQSLESIGHEILMRRQNVVRQRLPVGKRAYRERWIEIRQLVDQALRVERIGADHADQLAAQSRFCRVLRDQQRIAGTGRKREGETIPRRNLGH